MIFGVTSVFHTI